MKSYRPEIDGLRALAVLAVLFFHAKLGFHGGFVGVDIFFVISGFLITSIILRSIHTSTFSSLEFWERRVRRIAPALLVTVALTLVGAWLLYLPDDFKQVGVAAVAQSAFISNFFHMKVSGYFAPSAETLPFLHTWSLAVEEQFYILFPITLWLISRWRTKWIPGLIVFGFIVSFAASVVLTPSKPQSSFYLLHTRAWELLLGSMLAAYPSIGSAASRWVREVACWGGLLAMGLSITIFTPATPIPGYAALLPCLGATAFIWGNRDNLTSAGQVFAWKPLVFIGQISYSLYLVHWPLFVFSFYVFGAQLDWPYRVGLMGIAFVLAILSWAFVETPFRKKAIFGTRKSIFASAVTGTVVLLLAGVAIRSQQGFPSRFDPQVVRYADAKHTGVPNPAVSLEDVKSEKFIPLGVDQGDMQFMLWGDSHAMSLLPAVDLQSKKHGVRGCLAAYPATPPALDFISKLPFSLADQSPTYNQSIVDFAIKKRLKTVILAALWSAYAKDPGFEESLEKTVRTLTDAGIQVAIVQDVASLQDDVPRRLAMAARFGQDVQKIGVPLTLYREQNQAAESIFKKLAGPKVQVLDPAPLFVDENGLWRMERDGESMYCDPGHLSLKGALRIAPLFEKVFAP